MKERRHQARTAPSFPHPSHLFFFPPTFSRLLTLSCRQVCVFMLSTVFCFFFFYVSNCCSLYVFSLSFSFSPFQFFSRFSFLPFFLSPLKVFLFLPLRSCFFLRSFAVPFGGVGTARPCLLRGAAADGRARSAFISCLEHLHSSECRQVEEHDMLFECM